MDCHLNSRLFSEKANNSLYFCLLQTFNASYKAEEGHTDDICMTYMLFAWVESNEMFYDLLNDDGTHQLYFEAPVEPINMKNFGVFTSMEDFLKD